jgi:peptidoglycan/LPS O-acetylase OafA/YrhL
MFADRFTNWFQPHRPVLRDDHMSMPRADFYHPEIDILRFGAFFLVYLWHAMPNSPSVYAHLGFSPVVARVASGFLHGGAYGVDLFFALSSYLITELLLREYRLRQSIDVKAFYVRRLLRIWPLYFLALLVGPVIMHVIKPGQPLLEARYLLSFTFFIGNWACAWWGFAASVFNPLWSVSIEEQFYLSWPLVMKYWIRHIKLISFGLIVCASLARVYCVLADVKHPGVWCNTLCRLDPIAGGALLASFLNGRVPTFRNATRFAMITGALALLALTGIYSDFAGPTSLIGFPVAAVVSILLIAGTLGPVNGVRPARILQPLIYLGRISYGLYVFHVAAINLVSVPSGSGVRWALNLSESFGLTVLLAALSYRFVETPFLRLKQRFSRVESSPQMVERVAAA